MLSSNKSPDDENNVSHILIVEDDSDQMALLVDFAQNEIKKITESDNFNDAQKRKVSNIKIITATNTSSLKKATLIYKNVLLAISDCNIPDTKGGTPHDQFIKTNHRITGQHHTADILVENLPDTPVTMISSLNRFQKIVTQYYEKKHDRSLNFISKKDTSMIQKNMGYYIRLYVN